MSWRVRAGLALAAGTRGPRVDGGSLRTARAGLLAACGNVLHGALRCGRRRRALRAATSPRRWLNFLGGQRWPQSLIPVECAPPLNWVAPGAVEVLLAGGPAARGEAVARPPRR